jgi:hypothetical protein
VRLAVMVVNINAVILYLSQDDISALLGRKRGTVNVWRSRFKDTPDPFPEPDSGNGLVKTVPGWLPHRMREIVAWCKRHELKINLRNGRHEVLTEAEALAPAAADDGPDLSERVALVLIADGQSMFRVTPTADGRASVVATGSDPEASALLLTMYADRLSSSGLVVEPGAGALHVSEQPGR